MSVVPGVQDSLPGVVVHHGDMGVLVMEGDVCILITRRVGVVGKVDFGTSQVGVGDVKCTTDHERLSCAALGETGVPGLQHFQTLGLQATDHNVPRIGDGGVNGPQAVFIRHEVDVGGAAPGVRKGVVVSGSAQAALHQHASRAEMVFDDDVTLVLVVVQRAVVDHVTGACPRVWEQVLHEVLALHEISHGAVLQDTTSLEVAIHRPHLQREENSIFKQRRAEDLALNKVSLIPLRNLSEDTVSIRRRRELIGHEFSIYLHKSAQFRAIVQCVCTGIDPSFTWEWRCTLSS